MARSQMWDLLWYNGGRKRGDRYDDKRQGDEPRADRDTEPRSISAGRSFGTKIENAIDWSFIYEVVEEAYCEDNGRPSLDPVTLIKLPVLQYMFGIGSIRRTIKEADVNNAYRWFLGLGIHDPVPHFSTFGKNYTRRFKGTDLFKQIFQRILSECFRAGMVDLSVVFVDSTHVKARANGKKYHDEVAEEQALCGS